MYNTKVTSSKINEQKKHDASRDKHKAQGRAISLMEIIALLLGYPQVYTDIKFIHVPTTPLAERPAVEKVPIIRKQTAERQQPEESRLQIDDLDAGDLSALYFIRNIKLKDELPVWRCYTYTEALLIKDQLFSTLSIDNVTTFGLRPPELRFIRHIKWYFKWFYVVKNNSLRTTFSKQVKALDAIIKKNVCETMWIDGVGRNVYLRPCAIKTVLEYIRLRNECDFYGVEQYTNENMQESVRLVGQTAKSTILNQFMLIQRCIELADERDEFNEDETLISSYYLNVFDTEELRRKKLLNLPVVWFSSIKPSQGTRWLIHLLISMGEFDNEYNLYCHPTLKDCFIHCKLLSRDSNEHENNAKQIAKSYILEQLNYVPGGSKQFDRNVIAAYQTLHNVLLNETAITSEIPPVLYTQLQDMVADDCKNYI